MTPDEEVPGGWPPIDEVISRVVPLFPLPNLFLFPGTVVPLHIFEPRYRQMIEDSLDGPGRLVIGTTQDRESLPESGTEGSDESGAESGAESLPPPVHPIAGLGEIARHERLPDGRFVIMLVGLTRVHVREAPSERMYRKVEIEPLEEVPVPGGTAPDLRERLMAAVFERTPDLKDRADELPEDMPIGHLTDLLLLRMQLPQSVMQPLYSELVVAERARGALAEHAHRPILADEGPPESGTPELGEGSD